MAIEKSVKQIERAVRRCLPLLTCLNPPVLESTNLYPDRPIWKDRMSFQIARMSGLHLNLRSRYRRQRTYSQVAQKVQYILLIGCTQHVKLSDHLVGF